MGCHLGLAWFYKKKKNFLVFSFLFFLEILKVFLIHYKGKSWGTHSLKQKEMDKGAVGRKHQFVDHSACSEL